MSDDRLPIPVLIVDDNPANLKLATLVLEGEDFVVRTAAEAAEALLVLDTFPASVVLMDLQMPGMDGFELTRQLKANPRTRHLIVIALTAYAMKGDEPRAREAGCDGYIGKPIDTRRFAEQIRDVVQRARG